MSELQEIITKIGIWDALFHNTVMKYITNQMTCREFDKEWLQLKIMIATWKFKKDLEKENYPDRVKQAALEVNGMERGEERAVTFLTVINDLDPTWKAKSEQRIADAKRYAKIVMAAHKQEKKRDK